MLCMTTSSLHVPDTLIVFGPGTCCSILSAPPIVDRAPFPSQLTECVAALTAPADIRRSSDKQRLSRNLKRDIGPPSFVGWLADATERLGRVPVYGLYYERRKQDSGT